MSSFQREARRQEDNLRSTHFSRFGNFKALLQHRRRSPAAAQMPLKVVNHASESMLSLVTTSFFPLFGVLLSNALYLAPAPAVCEAVRFGRVGNLNVLPLSLMSVSSICWLMYAFSVPNAYIVASNLPGALAAMAYTVYTLPLMPREAHAERRTVQLVMIAGVAAISALWCLLTFADIDAPHRSFYLGAFASALCVIMFASPLSTLGRVLAPAALRPRVSPDGLMARPRYAPPRARSIRIHSTVGGPAPPCDCARRSSLHQTPPRSTRRSRSRRQPRAPVCAPAIKPHGFLTLLACASRGAGEQLWDVDGLRLGHRRHLGMGTESDRADPRALPGASPYSTPGTVCTRVHPPLRLRWHVFDPVCAAHAVAGLTHTGCARARGTAATVAPETGLPLGSGG